MCGLIAAIARVSGGFFSTDLDIFEQCALINTVRGRDAIGVMSGFKDRDAMVVKWSGKHPTLVFETKDWAKLRGRTISNGWFIAGHNRLATRGAQTTDNAHPFVQDHIILMHNGTIWNQDKLAPDTRVDVDSQAIAIAMSKDTPQKIIPEIRGAFALIWYNTETERLYAVRNEERPLSLIETKEMFYLSSEPWITAMPASRRGKEIKEITSIPPGTLLEWDRNGKMTTSEVTLAPKAVQVQTQGVYPRGGFQGRTNVPSDPDEDIENYQHWMQANGLVEDGGGDCVVPFVNGEKEPPEIKSLRTAIDQKRCALTTVETSTPTTKTGSDGKKPDSTVECDSLVVTREIARLEAQQRSIITPSVEFKKGTPILIKILEIQRLPNGAKRFNGKVRTPGRPMIDCAGLLPANTTAEDFASWIDTMVIGSVGWYTHTTGGPSVFVNDVFRAKYCDVHGEDVPSVLWDYAKLEGCTECHLPIFEWERPFTHLKLTTTGARTTPPRNALKIVCPDCVQKVLEGEIYDKYVEKYHAAAAKFRAKASDSSAAVQDRKPVSTEPVGKNGSTIVVPGPETLQ